MFYRTAISCSAIGAILFYLTGCSKKNGSVHQQGYYHSGIYFGSNLPENYQKGIVDGCSTSKGTYTKSHTLFNNDQDYNHGWFLGRNRCRHLLVIEEYESKMDK